MHAPADDDRPADRSELSLVESLIAEFLELRHSEGSRGPDLDVFCRRHPEHADAIREGVADLEALGFLAGSDESTRGHPATIGRYPVHGELGRGGMGVVYLARDSRLGRWLAIKRLPAAWQDLPEARARFEREARLLAALDHPNVGGIHAIEDDPDGPFLALAFVPGETLAERLLHGALPLPDALSVLRQIALALEAAHESAIVHRDLKPQNVKIDERGRVRVLDFGLAKGLEPEVEPHSGGGDAGPFHSRAGVLIGTPGYMSPEQIRGETIDPRTDLFAWGCLAFECLTGRVAFAGETTTERLDRTLNLGVDLSLLPVDLDPDVRSWIVRCLAGERDERPGSATELRRGLDLALAPKARAVATESDDSLGNLPRPWTEFVGRADLLARGLERLREERLVTLAGPGGAGKTRLSIEIARRAIESAGEGEPWWIDLSVLQPSPAGVGPAPIISMIASVTGTKGSSVEPLAAVGSELAARSGLLIFDNCEHVRAEVSSIVSAILAAAPRVRVLATSRETLGVTGEQVLRVPPLSLPDEDGPARSLDELLRSEAVQLFVARARAVRSDLVLEGGDLDALVAICRRLDGLPLALELAAARLATLSIADLDRRLEERLYWLSGRDAARQPRQRALRSLVDWSHDLLDEPSRVLFRRLSLFAGGATLESIESICTGEPLETWEILDHLGELVEKSLVELSGVGDRARYRMLETLRVYARDRLESSDERRRFELRHAQRFAAMVEAIEPSLEGEQQPEGLARLEAERDDLRVAIERMADEGRSELGMRILGAAWRFYSVRGHWLEGRRLAQRLIEATDRDDSKWGDREMRAVRARTLRCAGLLAMQQGDLEEAERQLGEGLEIERALDDRVRVASALNSLAQLALRRGRYDEAKQRFEENLLLARELDHASAIAMTLAMLGNVAQIQGDKDRARPYFEESLELSERLGNRYLSAGTLHNLAGIALNNGDPDRARELCRQALDLNRELGNRSWEARNLVSIGLADKLSGDYPNARRHYAQAMAIHRELGDKEGLRDGLHFFGMLAAALGQHRRALRLIAAAEAFTTNASLVLARGPRTRVEAALGEISRELSPADFEECRQRGAAMSLEAAVTEALDE
ncbi:MAG: tetratricopeptide repeat protein [Planctomycetes bacterium]|nr:tetratricopeptide repeat protein [Planctomycetota bacterium]